MSDQPPLHLLPPTYGAFVYRASTDGTVVVAVSLEADMEWDQGHQDALDSMARRKARS